MNSEQNQSSAAISQSQFLNQFTLNYRNQKLEQVYQQEKDALHRGFGIMNALLRALYIAIILNWYFEHPILSWLQLQIILPVAICFELVTAVVTYKFQQKHSQYLQLLFILLNAAENIVYTALVAPTNVRDNFPKPAEVSSFNLGILSVIVNIVALSLYRKWYYKTIAVLSFSASIYRVGVSSDLFFYLYPICICATMAHFYLRERTKRIIFFEKYNSQRELVWYKELIDKVLPSPLLVIKFEDKQKSKNQFSKDIISSAVQEEKSEDKISVSYQNSCFQNLIALEPLTMLKKLKVNARNFYDTLIEQCKKKSKLQIDSSHFHYDQVQCCELVDANSTNDSHFYDLRWADCYWGDDTAIMIMLNDVTLNKRFENEITRLSNYKDELLATVSHDLKTPLNGILTILEANKSEDNIQKMREKNEIAIKNSHLLNFLIQDILDYSMINKGKLRTVCQAFDVLEAAQEIVELEREQAEYKNIELRIVHDLRATDSKIFSDKRRLQQILLNFVGNAIKFTNQGEIVITLTKNREENILDISVRDSGCGIPEEIKGKLFQMFATYDLNAGSNRHGVGLGLTIAKKLVFELGPSGEITVDSQVGQGSCFSFKLFTQQRQLIKVQDNLLENILPESATRPDIEELLQVQKNGNSDYNVQLEEDAFDEITDQICEANDQHDALNDSGFISNMQSVKYANSKLDQNLVAIYKILHCDSNVRFLVIDDQYYNIRGIQLIFQKLGIEVDGEISGQAALDKLERVQRQQSFYTVLFVDVNMPGIDGLEVTRRVREMMNKQQMAQAKIVQCTAYTSDEDRKKCLAAGADSFLSKPVTVQSLRECFELLFKEA